MSVDARADGHGVPKWESEPHRWARERARYIDRATELDRSEADIVAYAELGYSSSGLAKHVGVSASTVKSKFDDIDDVDPTALLSRRPSELQVTSPIGVAGTDTGGSE
jgi:hypothetical protein